MGAHNDWRSKHLTDYDGHNRQPGAGRRKSAAYHRRQRRLAHRVLRLMVDAGEATKFVKLNRG